MRVTGRVTDAFGTPLDGVNIFVKSNPQNGAITNAFGQFAFTMTSPGILVFSHVGKEPYEVNPMNTISGNLGTIVLTDNFELEGVTVVGTPKNKKNTWLW
ncbi:carboxypeptidase-like regulatory domain-containing protein, partial [Arthrospira platensis SPKY1]|nr:carboxypeptidase-like regulatory domain-containing protein [Arthrospira platensis SPKY1]